jgi:chromosome segregation ATPase
MADVDVLAAARKSFEESVVSGGKLFVETLDKIIAEVTAKNQELDGREKSLDARQLALDHGFASREAALAEREKQVTNRENGLKQIRDQLSSARVSKIAAEEEAKKSWQKVEKMRVELGQSKADLAKVEGAMAAVLADKRKLHDRVATLEKELEEARAVVVPAPVSVEETAAVAPAQA